MNLTRAVDSQGAFAFRLQWQIYGDSSGYEREKTSKLSHNTNTTAVQHYYNNLAQKKGNRIVDSPLILVSDYGLTTCAFQLVTPVEYAPYS